MSTSIELSMQDVRRVTYGRKDFPGHGSIGLFSWHCLTIEGDDGQRLTVHLCREGDGNIEFACFPDGAALADGAMAAAADHPPCEAAAGPSSEVVS